MDVQVAFWWQQVAVQGKEASPTVGQTRPGEKESPTWYALGGPEGH